MLSPLSSRNVVSFNWKLGKRVKGERERLRDNESEVALNTQIKVGHMTCLVVK